MTNFRVAVDTGGTFTDFVFWTSRQATSRSPRSYPPRPTRPFRSCEASKTSSTPTRTASSTSATERRLAPTRCLRRRAYALACWSRPASAASTRSWSSHARTGRRCSTSTTTSPRCWRRRAVPARWSSASTTLAKNLSPLDEEALRETVRELAGQGVESMAVCLLFAYLHPQHEQRVREIIQEELPDCFVSLSSDVLPQIREYRTTEHHGHQRLPPADRAALPGKPARPAARARRHHLARRT